MTKRILVIDDDVAVRESFALALSGLEYEVATAPDGQQGLRAVNECPPDLVFLDLRMPGMDGVEVLRRLQPQLPHTPVYIATAYRRDYMEPLRLAAAAGYRFEVMDKPLDREQIRAIVEAACGRHQVL